MYILMMTVLSSSTVKWQHKEAKGDWVEVKELFEDFKAVVRSMSRDELLASAQQAYEDSIDSYLMDEKE